MAISAPTVLAVGGNNSATTSRNTGPFTPTPGRHIYTAAAIRAGDVSVGVMTGAIAFSGGGTWSLTTATVNDDKSNRHASILVHGVVPADAGTNIVGTISAVAGGPPAAVSFNRSEWVIWEDDGGLASITNIASAYPTPAAATPSIDLPSNPLADSVVYGIVASVSDNNGVQVGEDWELVGHTGTVTLTPLLVQRRTGITTKPVPFRDCGTAANLLWAFEVKAATPPAARSIRARAANTADGEVMAEVAVGADVDRWHTYLAEIDSSAGKLRLHVAGYTAIEVSLTGTLATQTGDLIMGATLASGAVVSQAIDAWHNAMASGQSLLSAEMRDLVMQRLAEELAPSIDDWSASVAANTLTSIGLSAQVKDPYRWGWEIDPSTTPLDDGCTVAIVGATLSVRSRRAGTARISVVIASKAPLAPRTTAILTLDMTVAADSRSPIGLWNVHGMSPLEDGHQAWNDDVCKLGQASNGQGGWDDWNSYMMRAGEAGGSHRKVKVIGMWPGWRARPASLSSVGFGGRNSADGRGTKGLYRLCREEGLIPSVSLPLRHEKMPDGTNTPPGFEHLLTVSGMDQYYRNYCDKLKSYGYTVGNKAKIIMRMAWEAQDSYGFGHSLNQDWDQYLTVTGGTPVNPYQYNKSTGKIVLPDEIFSKFKAAWNRIASLLKNELGDVCVMDFCYFHTPAVKAASNDSSSPWRMPFHPDECLPSLSLIDILSADAYDGRGPSEADGGLSTIARQDAYMNHRFRTTRGNSGNMVKSIPVLSSGSVISDNSGPADFAPTGLHQWYQWVQSKNKPFALPEWGCKSTDRPDGEFIRMIYRYYTEEWNSRVIYHYYFNRSADGNALRPDGAGGTYHPNSIAAWRETFGARPAGFPVTPD